MEQTLHWLPDFASPTGQTELWNIPNNPSYSSEVSMAFNLGGALADISWLEVRRCANCFFPL